MPAHGSSWHQLPCCLLPTTTALLRAPPHCAIRLHAGLGASKMATEVLWSDPAKAPGLFANESRGVGLIFGPDITKVSRGSCGLPQAVSRRRATAPVHKKSSVFRQSIAAEQLWQCMALRLQAFFGLSSAAVHAWPVCIPQRVPAAAIIAWLCPAGLSRGEWAEADHPIP